MMKQLKPNALYPFSALNRISFNILYFTVILTFVGCGTGSGDKSAAPEILHQFKQSHPAQFDRMKIHAINSKGTLLCFRSRDGGTLIYNKRSDRIEPVQHAKFIAPGQVTRIQYQQYSDSGVFILWSGDVQILSISAAE